MKEEKPTILDREEKKENEAKAILGDTCYIREVSLPDFETEIPAIVLSELGINLDEADGVEVQFIKENSGRIYIEKVQMEETKAEEKTIVLDKEKKTTSKEDYYTEYERRIKEEFEPGSVSIKKIDQEWNIKLPDNIHYALGLNNGDHVRFEAVDRETFKISKIR